MLNDEQGHDWNEGHPDHEGVMAVAQLHRIIAMAESMLDSIGENDELEGWVQYKISRAYNDLSDVFTYVQFKAADVPASHSDSFLDEAKKKKKGLWANIHAKRKRGERPAKPGDKDYPDAKTWKKLTSETTNQPIVKLDEQMLRSIIDDVINSEIK